MKRASTNPIDKTTINIKKTYFGALDVIKNILFGSKNLNIETIYIAIQEFLIFFRLYPIKGAREII